MGHDFKNYQMEVDSYQESGTLIKEVRPKKVSLFKDNKKECLVKLYPDGTISSYISDISKYLDEKEEVLTIYYFYKDGSVSDQFTFYPDGSFSDAHLFGLDEEDPLNDLKKSLEAICYLLKEEINDRFPSKLVI